jgi:hypothetical protein
MPNKSGTRADGRYRISGLRIFAHRAISIFPPVYREKIAERFFRRGDAPAPAAEHVLQFLLSAYRSEKKVGKKLEATVAKGADNFYKSQYRQELNPTMGAFAMTATQVLLGTGGKQYGYMWSSSRATSTALIEKMHDSAPILVLNERIIAIPLWLPQLTGDELKAKKNWCSKAGPMPAVYRNLIEGKEVNSYDSSVKSFERDAVASTLEVIDNLLNNPRLALLALHPHDPDAMGLHISLFGVELVDDEKLQQEYGLQKDVIGVYQDVARRNGSTLLFAVGGTEEVFTQCSQNLFSKRLATTDLQNGVANKWAPSQPLENFIKEQFELIQITVSSSGLPGASPRNGEKGKAAFVGRRNNKLVLLIPYHPGNFIHGHAAKLWSNPFGSLIISDDHTFLTRVIISGPCRVQKHSYIKLNFPEAAVAVADQKGRTGKPIPEPEYWFIQDVAKLIIQSEPLPMNILFPGRETCSISAGGQAMHGKKPGYFAADNLPFYDLELQHKRELGGREIDLSGVRNSNWQALVADALTARLSHLQAIEENASLKSEL